MWLAGAGDWLPTMAGTKALVVLGGDKHTRDELVSAALGSLDRACSNAYSFVAVRPGATGGDDLGR